MSIDILEIKTKSATQSARLRQMIVRELNKQKIHHHWSKESRRTSQNQEDPFDFSARVAVTSTRHAAKPIHGKTGTILGRAPGRDGWTYAVFIDDQDECWSLSHDELDLISKPLSNGTNHPVKHVRVVVDKKGRGYPVQHLDP